MMKLRPACCAALAVLLTVGLCSCGRREAEPPPPKTVLRIIHYESEGQQAWINVFNSFMEENPDIAIDYDLTGGDEYMKLLRARFLSNEPMDIVGVHPGGEEALLYARSGYLHDITGEPFLEGIRPDALESGMWENRHYGVPLHRCYIVCLYNQDIFEKYGLTPPGTWSEFLSICRRLASEGETPIAQGIKEPFVTQLIAIALAVTAVYRDDPHANDKLLSGEAGFSTPEWKKVMEMYQSLAPYFSEGFEDITYHQCLSDFASQKAAMTVMGTFSLQLLKLENPHLRYGAFVLPASEDGDNWTPFSVGGMMAINEQSEHKEEALRFFTYLMRDDVYYRFLSECLNLPVRERIPVDYDPVLEQLASTTGNTFIFMNREWPLELSEAFRRGIQEMFAGLEIDDVLRKLDDVAARLAEIP